MHDLRREPCVRAMHHLAALAMAAMPFPALGAFADAPGRSPVSVYSLFAIVAEVVIILLLWEALSDHSTDRDRLGAGHGAKRPGQRGSSSTMQRHGNRHHARRVAR